MINKKGGRLIMSISVKIKLRRFWKELTCPHYEDELIEKVIEAGGREYLHTTCTQCGKTWVEKL